MLHINKLKSIFFLVLFLGINLLSAQESEWPPVLKIKIDKVLEKEYQSDNLTFEAVEISQSTEKNSVSKLSNNLFKVNSAGKFVGYIYASQAPSQDEVFDYLVVFNPKLEIAKAKVLIYREQHGRQIGSVRWLNQFEGMTVEDNLSLGKNIDGISGATISANSMTVAVSNLLSSIKLAKENGDL